MAYRSKGMFAPRAGCRLVALLLAIGLALTIGCSTTLDTTHFQPQPWLPAKQAPAANGIYYALPAVEYMVKVTRKLVYCDVGLDKKGKQVWVIKIRVSTEITSSYKPDRYATYFIDYRWLDKFAKQTELRIDLYENGTLKSLNAGFTDNTAEILEKTVGTALNLVSSAIGFPSGIPLPQITSAVGEKSGKKKESKQPPTQPDILKKNVRAALASIGSLRKQIAVHKAEIVAKENAIKVMAARSPVDLEALVKSEGALKLLQMDLVEEESRLAKYEALLSSTAVIRLTPRIFPQSEMTPEAREALAEVRRLHVSIVELRAQILEKQKEIEKIRSGERVDEKVLEAKENELEVLRKGLLGSLDQLARYKGKLSSLPASELPLLPFPLGSDGLMAFDSGAGALEQWFKEKVLEQAGAANDAAKAVGVTLEFYGVNQTPGQKLPKDQACCFGSPTDTPGPGLVYRQPLLTRWRICRGLKSDPCGRGDGKNVLAYGEELVPQLGLFMTLPLESDAFEDQTLKAQFRADGSLEFAEFSDKAGAVKASNAFASSAGSLAQFITARQQADQTKAADEAARLDAETKRLQAELALKKARQELNEYNQSLSGN